MSEKIEKIINYLQSIRVSSTVVIKSFQIGIAIGIVIGIIYYVNRS